MLRSATTSYYQADGLGSVSSLSNSASALAQTYTYDSFGKLTASSGSLTNPFQYTAREFDPEANLYYYRARRYDPTIGRFISEDSVKFAAGVNFYRYAENNPVRFTDPYGHGVWACVLCIWYQYPDPVDLCSATNSPNPGDAYFKECFAKQPSCQKMVASCGVCSLWPPKIGDPHFHR